MNAGMNTCDGLSWPNNTLTRTIAIPEQPNIKKLFRIVSPQSQVTANFKFPFQTGLICLTGSAVALSRNSQSSSLSQII